MFNLSCCYITPSRVRKNFSTKKTTNALSCLLARLSPRNWPRHGDLRDPRPCGETRHYEWRPLSPGGLDSDHPYQD